MEDKTPVQWSMEDDGSLALRLLAVGVILILSAFITYIIFRMILWMTI
jgi:predicted DNA repair protein MutK